ncbi:aromatic amino acid transport family protein [Bisgaard Taxon 10/6]|uniref:aromatic amino acid transport family protein n=1 Tax=Exercitatus varius TaxID=67857 RepID=UPI00294B4DA3|nr:aromatic amino acid transport family protein [Exercitatus varius]MDG2960537.1 aromatic amino acid transport family protein [Exercitatus varius]
MPHKKITLNNQSPKQNPITLAVYVLWQRSTHGVLSQNLFLQILRQDPSLNGLVTATQQITNSDIIAEMVKIFSALALITSFLDVTLDLFECEQDLFTQTRHKPFHYWHFHILVAVAIRSILSKSFILALGYAG